MRVYGLVSQRLFPNFLHTKGVKDRGLDFFDDSNWRSIGSEVRSYTFNWDFSNGISKFSVPLEEKSNPTAPAAWLVNLFLELLRWSCFGLFMPHGMWSIGECDILRGKISHLVVWQFGGQGKHGHAADTQGVRSQICCGESPRALGQRVPLGDQKILTLEATAKHMLSCGSWALVLCSSKVMPWAFARTPTERGLTLSMPSICSWFENAGGLDNPTLTKRTAWVYYFAIGSTISSLLGTVWTWMHFLLNSKHWGQVKLLRVIGFVNILCGKISHLVVWQFGGQGKHGHAADTQGVRSQICCGESPRALGQRVPLGDQKILTLEATAKHMLSCGSWALVLCSSKVMSWAFARTPTERGSLSPCPSICSWFENAGGLDNPTLTKRTAWVYYFAIGSTISSLLGTVWTWMHFLLNSKHWGQVKLLRVIGFVNILCGKISSSCSLTVGGQGKHGHAADTQGVRSQICCGEVPVPGAESATGDQKILTLEATAKHMLSCVLGLWSFAAAKSCHERSPERQLKRGSLSPCPPCCSCLKMREVWTIQHWRNGLLGVLLCNRLNDFKLAWNGMDMNALPFEFKTLRSSQAIESHRICQYFVRKISHLVVWQFGGQGSMATQRHTGSSLPDMLWGKSPCLGAESATGRPEDLDSGSDSEAHAELWFLGFGPLQQQSHAWAFARTPTERGSLSPCPPLTTS